MDGSYISSAAAVQLSLKGALHGISVRWEDPAKLHLTLRFLGDIGIGHIDELAGVLNRLKFDFEKINFEACNIGFFPNQKFPNVVYIGLEEIGENSAKLVGFIDKIVYNFGVKPDKRFVPHITLGRFSRNKRIQLTKMVEVNFEKFNIEFTSFCLMKSELTSGGSVHSVIKEIDFSN